MKVLHGMHPLLLAGFLSGQTALTIPAAFDATDAPARLWIAGATKSMRQQIVIDAGHLQTAPTAPIAAIAWRREAGSEAFAGGTMHLRVHMAETMSSPERASAVFDDNLGPAPVLVFDGTVTLPNAGPLPAQGLTWQPGNSARVVLTTPYTYQGGHLVIDVVGTAASNPVAWWPADAAWDPTRGQVSHSGRGCGNYVDQGGAWATADEQSLVPGATAILSARGTPGGLGLLFLSLLPPVLPGAPLQAVLPGSDPVCSIYLSAPAAVVIEGFVELGMTGAGARADHALRLPGEGWLLGASFHTQWLDLAQNATSNATTCTVAATMPTLGMTSIQGRATDARGALQPHVAHVLHFEFQ